MTKKHNTTSEAHALQEEMLAIELFFLERHHLRRNILNRKLEYVVLPWQERIPNPRRAAVKAIDRG